MGQSLRLPDTFGSAGDPVEGNPFNSDDRRHKVWADATRAAEEEVARVNAAGLSSLTPENAGSWMPAFVSMKFDVWAKRGLHVVGSDAGLSQYGLWLVAYANSWIDEMSRFYETAPPPFSVEGALLALRNSLGARVQYWRSEALRFRREQLDLASQAPEKFSKTVTAKVVSRRKLLLRRHRSSLGLGAIAFARKVAVGVDTIRGIVKEDTRKFSEAKRQQLLNALGVTLDDWYRE